MIADVKICSVIEAQFPQLQWNEESRNFYRYFDDLSKQAQQWIYEEQLPLLEQCMILVNKLYQHSSSRVRNAIENIFIYHIIRPLQQSQLRFEIKKVMPEALRDLMYRYLYNAGI